MTSSIFSRALKFANRVGNALAVRVKWFIRPLTANEQAFIAENRQVWGNTPAASASGRYVFVHHELYPLALLGNLHIACAIATEMQAKIVLVSPSWLDRASNQVLKSFPGVQLQYRDSPAFVFRRLLSYFLAYMALGKIKTPEDLLAFKCDGIPVGDVLYDTILARGYASVSRIDRCQLVPVMASFLFNRAMVKAVLAQYKVVAGLASHIVGVPGATFVRMLIKQSIPVYIRETTIKKYTSLEMMFECCATPDKRYIDFMKRQPKLFSAYGERALENRLGNKYKTEIDHLAYKADKTVYTRREEFGRDFGLDPKKKNVFVMLHAFNDYPHTYGPMVHQDFYHWFMHVLEIAKKNKDVNWIFKNHPYEKYYPTDVNVGAIFDMVSESHIKYMPAEVNFNTSSLRNIGDAVITCLGTAGLEYSAFGLPCILAARCWYSGHGFTREPANRAEFERDLMNIAHLPRLSEEQVTAARCVAYFTFEAMNQLKFPDPYRTIATYDLDEGKEFTPDQMIETILRFRASASDKDKQAYMTALYEFIRDPQWLQFVDFARHPELKRALRPEDGSHQERGSALPSSIAA